MLEPQERRLLLEALRPPDGYALEAAIGTTFSLDLVALLTAPLSFALFDWQDDDGRPLADPLALVEAVRRHADRMALFCQAGEIKVPTGDHRLLSYLEESVVEVAPRVRNRVFHPKAWALRYVSPSEGVKYRLVCLTRNLTFDRSWDTAVVLDGKLTDRQRPFHECNALGDFFQALPNLALRPVSPRVLAEVDRMQRDLRVVHFEVPEPFEGIAFWPLGIPGAESPWDYEHRRLLVISPFLADKALGGMTDTGEGHVLISRPESLAALEKATLEAFDRVCTLGDAAEGEIAPDDDPAEREDSVLRGLHAKVYVAERGWDASLLTGSANATDAAFGGNVEFLVELKGKKSRCGIDALLAPSEGQPTLASLLQDMDLPENPEQPDPAEVRLEALLTRARQSLMDAEPRLRIRAGEGETFSLSLEFQNKLQTPPDATVSVWPITLKPELAKAVTPSSTPLELGPVSLEALTSFTAFQHRGAGRGGAGGQVPLRSEPPGGRHAARSPREDAAMAAEGREPGTPSATAPAGRRPR